MPVMLFFLITVATDFLAKSTEQPVDSEKKKVLSLPLNGAIVNDPF